MSEPIDPIHCVELRDELDRLNDDLDFWESELAGGSLWKPGQVRARIRSLRERIAVVERLLTRCADRFGEIAFDGTTDWVLGRGIYVGSDAGDVPPTMIIEGGYLPAWSPNGRLLAYYGERGLTVRTASSGAEVVLENAGFAYCWSPTSDAIVSAEGLYWLTIALADGSAPPESLSEHIGAADPSWSPAGDAVAFDTDTRITGGIFMVRVDTREETMLTENHYDAMPIWSPDGGSIYFDRGGTITAVDVESLEVREILTNGYLPSWSPDGRRFAYQTMLAGYEGGQIAVADADGQNSTVLTEPARYDQLPVWLPSGRIVFSHTDASGLTMRLLTIDPDNPADVAEVTAGMTFIPTWWDGRGVYNAMNPSGRSLLRQR